MPLGAVTEPIRQPMDRPLEPRVLEGREPPAPLADSVMVVVAARDHRLISGSTLIDLDLLNQPLAVQQVQGSIDAGDPDAPATGADPVGDLLGTEAAVLLGEQVDHRSARAARSPALR